MNAAKLFLWISLAVAGVSFVGALAAGATWATRFRASDGDSARSAELRDRALEKMDKGDLGGSRTLTERVLAIDPEDSIARANLGRIYKGQGDYARAIAEHKLAIAASPDLPDLYYNVACYYALLKREEDAIAWLGRALEHGFARLEWLRDDPDLESLRGNEQFELLRRTGKLPTGAPRIQFHSARQATVGRTFEISVVVEREVPESGAREAARSASVAWEPDSDRLELVSSEVSTLAEKEDGIVVLRTTGRYVVRPLQEGMFALPPARFAAAGETFESGSSVVEVLSAPATGLPEDP